MRILWGLLPASEVLGGFSKPLNTLQKTLIDDHDNDRNSATHDVDE